jgi:transcription factor SPN1
MSDSDDSQPTTPLSEAGHDPGDPNRPISEERDRHPPPAPNPDLDMDEDEDNDPSDLESLLSEVDEAEFADFDPTTVALEDRPLVGIDEDIARTLKAGKRKRADKDGEGKKPKEGKREKKKKARHDEDEDPDGEELDGKRIRKTKRIDGERKDRDKPRERRPPTPENEENLTPEERRRRALDRAMDAALKNPNKRRRKKDEVVCIVLQSYEGNDSNKAAGPRRSLRRRDCGSEDSHGASL